MGILRKLLNGKVMQSEFCLRMINQRLIFEVNWNKLELEVRTRMGIIFTLMSRPYGESPVGKTVITPGISNRGDLTQWDLTRGGKAEIAIQGSWSCGKDFDSAWEFPLHHMSLAVRVLDGKRSD